MYCSMDKGVDKWEHPYPLVQRQLLSCMDNVLNVWDGTWIVVTALNGIEHTISKHECPIFEL